MLAGTTIIRIGRRGKFLKIVCDPLVLVSHLRMEGKYRLAEQGEPYEKHTHVIFHFTDGTELRYRDVRQFGTMHLFPYGEEDEQLPLKKLGPEPLTDEFQLSWFKALLAKRKTNIKAVLLNQEYMRGAWKYLCGRVFVPGGDSSDPDGFIIKGRRSGTCCPQHSTNPERSH